MKSLEITEEILPVGAAKLASGPNRCPNCANDDDDDADCFKRVPGDADDFFE